MNGWMGKILRVNLSNGEINEEKLDSKVVRDFVGGRGLAIYFMLKEVDPNCDALGKVPFDGCHYLFEFRRELSR